MIFQTIPDNILVPGNYTEVNPNRAASQRTAVPKRLLLVGARLDEGEVDSGVPFRIFATADADRGAGAGSQLAGAAAVVKEQNRFVELWGIGLDDNAAGVPATSSVTVAVDSPVAGTIALYVSPYMIGPAVRGRYQIAVAAGATASAIATAIAAAINADPYRLVDATSLAAVVTLTARNAGTQGNSLVCEHSYQDGESLPNGITLTITAFASGAANPDVATAIAAMSDAHTTHLSPTWTDSISMSAYEAEMDRRWSGTVQRECHLFTGVSGSLGTLTTFGDARNSPLASPFGTGFSPTPPWLVAAEVAAIDVGMNHPGQPLRGRPIKCMFAPKAGKEFDSGERQQLLAEGISTYTVRRDGVCVVERLVTSYQTDTNGNPDSKFRDRQVAGLLFACRYDWRTFFGSKYPDFMHGADGTVVDPGVPVITPSTVRAELEGRGALWARLGWIEGLDQFIEDIEVERTEDGFDTVNAPDLINRLHVTRNRFDFLR